MIEHFQQKAREIKSIQGKAWESSMFVIFENRSFMEANGVLDLVTFMFERVTTLGKPKLIPENLRKKVDSVQSLFQPHQTSAKT